jgi:hypothetical protein
MTMAELPLNEKQAQGNHPRNAPAKRVWLLWTGLGLGLGILGIGLSGWTNRDLVNGWDGPSLCNNIKPGMTESEVASIVGRPSDSSTVNDGDVWWGKRQYCALFVQFDSEGKVVGRKFETYKEDVFRQLWRFCGGYIPPPVLGW